MVKTLSATNPLTYTFVTSPKLLPIKETTSGEPESVLKRTPLSWNILKLRSKPFLDANTQLLFTGSMLPSRNGSHVTVSEFGYECQLTSETDETRT